MVPRGPDAVIAADPFAGPVRDVSDEVTDDVVIPFAVEPLDVRGRVARLGKSISHILASHNYPSKVSRLVAESAALAVLLASSLKIDGRFQLLARGDGPVGMLIVDFDAPDRLRALARFDAQRLHSMGPSADLIGAGHLAVTIEQGDDLARYQGIVAIEGEGLEQAAQKYFDQSLQIPTRLKLAAAKRASETGISWCAGGIMSQYLPHAKTGGVSARPPATRTRDDAWREAEAHMATVEPEDLVDPSLSSERLLYHLFHEPGVRVFKEQPVRAACRCSTGRIQDILRRFSADERKDMTGDDGMIGVTCEFCSVHRVFDPKELEG